MSIKDRLGLSEEPVFLMDGTAFLYRAFFTARAMQRSDGFPTNVLVGVSRLLLRLLREEKPQYFLFVRDGHGPNFRHSIYPEYKANRDATPEDLVRQIPAVSRMVKALGFAEEVTSGFEADDCLATLAARFSSTNPVIIVSGDKDLKQCLAPNVFLWNLGGKEETLLTEADFRKEYGIEPAAWADVQAVIGDSVDNIPGVPGIGPKTAAKLFTQVSCLEDIETKWNLLPPKIAAKLEPYRKEIFTYRQLTRLSLEYTPVPELSALAVAKLDATLCAQLAAEFELVALRREMIFVHETQSGENAHIEEAWSMKLSGTTKKAPAKRTATQKKRASRLAAPKNPYDIPRILTFSTYDLRENQGKTVAILYENAERVRYAVADTDSLVQWADPNHQCILTEEDLEFGEEEFPITERIWDGGPMEEFCQWLDGTDCVAVNDLKTLAHDATFAKFIAQAKPKLFDLGLAAYLLNPEESDYSWLHIQNHLALPLQNGFRGPATLALLIYPKLLWRLNENGLLRLYENLEMPLAPVLARMEQEGLGVRQECFAQFLDEVQEEIQSCSKKIYSLAGTAFNIRSSQQLAHILFDVLKLKGGSKTKGGAASTSQENLEKLRGAHPIIEHILEFRKYEKLRSTYLEPLPTMVDANNRLHTTFNQTGTATGRLSSSEPNLQNIPARGIFGQRMRSCFVPREGHFLLSSDYSQIELRVLAQLSKEPNLVEAFRKNLDIHTETASLIYGVSSDVVDKDMRSLAKTINFGLIYGMGAQKLARELGITIAEAKTFMTTYFAKLPGLHHFTEDVVRRAKEVGYVVTLGGRRRYLPDLLSQSSLLNAQAARQAINTLVQGSAADIIKLAMLACSNDAEIQALGGKMLLQIHDELLFEVPCENAEALGARVQLLMEGVKPATEPLIVPLRCSWKYGANWSEAH